MQSKRSSNQEKNRINLLLICPSIEYYNDLVFLDHFYLYVYLHNLTICLHTFTPKPWCSHSRLRRSQKHIKRLFVFTEATRYKNGLFCRCDRGSAAWRHGHFCSLWFANLWMADALGEKRHIERGTLAFSWFLKCSAHTRIGWFFVGAYASDYLGTRVHTLIRLLQL